MSDGTSSSRRIALWLIGAAGSLLLVILQVLLTHSVALPVPTPSLQSYVLDFAERVMRPTFLSFFTVCLIGFLYEVIMRADDQSGLQQLITASVRAAIFGRAELLNQYPSLSDQQNQIKEQLIDCTKELHKRRLSQFERLQILEIHEFDKIWEVLINSTFGNDEPFFDFTIGSNALLRFQAYQFRNYYSNLFQRRSNYRHSRSKVKILILCDYDSGLPGAAARAEALSRELENSVKMILERIRDYSRLGSSLTPSDVYRRASNNATAAYEFRLATSRHISGDERLTFETPFNIYGSLALSQSFVAAVDSHENQPLPHLAVSLRAEAINQARSRFESVWTKAFADVTKFADTMNSWEDFGSGTLLKKWADIS